MLSLPLLRQREWPESTELLVIEEGSKLRAESSFTTLECNGRNSIHWAFRAQYSHISVLRSVAMGLFGRKKQSAPAAPKISEDEEKLRQMVDLAASIDAKIAMSDRK